MEQFYLENVAKYHSLVAALDPTPKPRVSTEQPGPNMTIAARIRPLPTEESFPSAIFPRSSQKTVMDIHDLYNHPSGIPTLKSYDYEVDRLFGSECATREIYDSLVAALVPFAWEGGISTLFAYGQTGSGKTYTISRIQQLVADTMMENNFEGDREIYLTIIDIAGKATFDLLKERTPIALLDDASGVTHMRGAGEHRINTKEEMKEMMDRATSFRRTESTFKNDTSSRSHAVCRIRISDPATGSDGLFYLIDLAGSESARDMANHGSDRLRETKQINVSLSVLKDCIRGKAQADVLKSSEDQKPGQKMPYIPVRQSALTKVLKHVFDPVGTQDCKTVVIACVNPSLADVPATRNTMRFAEMLRVLVPKAAADLDPMAPMNWTNNQLKAWIKDNAGAPPVLPQILAPRETGAQLLNLTSLEFEYRCQRCPGVKSSRAKALRSKFWQLQLDAQARMTSNDSTTISKD